MILQKGLTGGTWFSESPTMNKIGNTVTLQWFYYQLKQIIEKECENMMIKSHNLKYALKSELQVDKFDKLSQADIQALWNEDLLWKYMIENKKGQKQAAKSLIKILNEVIDKCAESPKMDDLHRALFDSLFHCSRYCFIHASSE